MLGDIRVNAVPSTTIRTALLAIANNANMITAAVGSTVAALASDDSLLHRAIGREVLEEPRFEAAGLEVAVGNEWVGRGPVGDVVDGEVLVGVVGGALGDAGVVEVGSQPAVPDIGIGGVEEPAEGAATGVFGAFVFACLDALLSLGIGFEELDKALIGAYES